MKSVGESIMNVEHVYAIHQGSVNEGGGIGDSVYRDIQLTLEIAGTIVEDLQKEQDEIYGDDEWSPKDWTLIGEGHWSNGIDEVKVLELRVLG